MCSVQCAYILYGTLSLSYARSTIIKVARKPMKYADLLSIEAPISVFSFQNRFLLGPLAQNETDFLFGFILDKKYKLMRSSRVVRASGC